MSLTTMPWLDKILQEYEPRLVSSLPKIISEIQDEIEKGQSLEETIYQDEEVRIKEFKYVEEFEEKFYSLMNRAKEKLGLS